MVPPISTISIEILSSAESFQFLICWRALLISDCVISGRSAEHTPNTPNIFKLSPKMASLKLLWLQQFCIMFSESTTTVSFQSFEPFLLQVKKHKIRNKLTWNHTLKQFITNILAIYKTYACTFKIICRLGHRGP